MSESRFPKDRALFARAERVIPGGIYGHQQPGLLVEGEFPFFVAEADGCRITDPDGNRYIDFLCAYGPMVVGYGNEHVEAAAAEQRARCDSGNLPAPNLVELAEVLVARTPGADWSMFAKNGSDATTWAIALAREATGRDVVAMAKGAYHGVHGWCNGLESGFPASDRAEVAKFPWNDLAALEEIFASKPEGIAAVILTPFRHEAFGDSVLPADGFLPGVRALCDRYGAVLIMDDVRAGFRLHPGGSSQVWGVSPDLLVYSKALANGYPVSALLGTDALRAAARRVFVTGTFFTQAVPIAAALATLQELDRVDGIAHMERVGRRLTDGLAKAAAAQGLEVVISGPPSIPFMTFVADAGSFERARAFATSCIRRGVFFHPTHNWFVSTAHSDADIDEALAVAAEAFVEVARVS